MIHKRNYIYTVFKSLFNNKVAFISFIIIVIFFLIGIFAPYLAPNDPQKVVLSQKLNGPSKEFLLGTDHLGRCILSRIIYGTRISLFSVCFIIFMILLISVPIAMISGYFGGKIDNFIMRVVDVFLAFPSVLLCIVIAGFWGQSLINIIIVLSSVWWAKYARVIRGMVLSIKQKDFIMAAKSCGTSSIKIILRHILPNIVPTIIILATIDMENIILSISGLSFLGLGAQPPIPEWGTMLSEGKNYIQIAPRIMICPGLTIMVVIMAFNLLGDALRDIMDPKYIKR